MKWQMFFWTVMAGGIFSLWGVGQVLAEQTPIRGGPEKPATPLPAPEPNQPPLNAAPAKPTESVLLESRQVEAAILKALAEPSEADFLETPLKDVLAFWQKRHKIPIVFDEHGVEEKRRDQPVTLHRKEASFRAILEQVLEPLELTWSIRYDSLWITSQMKGTEHVVTRVYDVADLLTDSAQDKQTRQEDLIEIITRMVAPQSWSEVGGSGRIEPLILRGKPVLVIGQTWPVHLEIMRLLEELREAASRESPKENGAKKAAQSEPASGEGHVASPPESRSNGDRPK